MWGVSPVMSAYHRRSHRPALPEPTNRRSSSCDHALPHVLPSGHDRARRRDRSWLGCAATAATTSTTSPSPHRPQPASRRHPVDRPDGNRPALTAPPRSTIGFALELTKDGNGPFTPEDGPGADAGDDNGIVRTLDAVTYRVTMNSTGGVSTNERFTLTAPAGTSWAGVPGPCTRRRILDRGCQISPATSATSPKDRPSLSPPSSTSPATSGTATGSTSWRPEPRMMPRTAPSLQPHRRRRSQPRRGTTSQEHHSLTPEHGGPRSGRHDQRHPARLPDHRRLGPGRPRTGPVRASSGAPDR